MFSVHLSRDGTPVRPATSTLQQHHARRGELVSIIVNIIMMTYHLYHQHVLCYQLLVCVCCHLHLKLLYVP